jgi:hypothetical protein
MCQATRLNIRTARQLLANIHLPLLLPFFQLTPHLLLRFVEGSSCSPLANTPLRQSAAAARIVTTISTPNYKFHELGPTSSSQFAYSSPGASHHGTADVFP